MDEQIDQLKNALREVMLMISLRNQPLSNELKALLVQVMEHVANRIQELRAIPLKPNIPDLNPAPYPSSNINSFKYDYDNGNLLVKFQDKYPGENGSVYEYSGVPKFIYDVFRRGAVAPKTSGKNKWHEWIRGVTPSLGAAMYHLIRSNYPYQKIS